ncbi:MAG: peroxide stress protein YaaA, partial [Bacteroidota bacterium]|nr:peroxide stress protein YaaA [Bacteroidota bacterium]
MIAIISPAKTLDFSTQSAISEGSDPQFLEEAIQLIDVMKKYSPSKLGALLKISPDLAQLNYVRFHTWSDTANPDISQFAALAFNGEVYRGLDAKTLTKEELLYSQKSIRILSGLYGLLRPLDWIQPYRLDMGVPVKGAGWNNLYEYWGDKIAKELNQDILDSGSPYLINLASAEYFKAITRKLDFPVITPVFKQGHEGQYRAVTVYAKKARGLMTRFIIQNKITEPEDLKAFDVENYYYNSHLSTEKEWVFTREEG